MVQWTIFNVYSSKYNKESLNTLNHVISLPDFLDLKEFIEMRNHIERCQHKDSEMEQKLNNNR